jgi:formyl-CoA transferase
VQSSLLQSQIALLDFQAARYLMKGEVAGQVGNDHPVGMPTSAYTSSDGYININSLGQAMWVRLCKTLGKEELASHPDYKGPAERSKNRKALNTELNQLFKAKTSAEWTDILLKADVPCGPIYKMDQVFADPQVRHLQAAATVKHPKLGELKIVNQAVKLSRTPASMVRATPEQGEHTDEILAEMGYSAAEIAAFHAAKVV